MKIKTRVEAAARAIHKWEWDFICLGWNSEIDKLSDALKRITEMTPEMAHIHDHDRDLCGTAICKLLKALTAAQALIEERS